MISTTADFPGIWQAGLSYARFLRESSANCALWEGVYRTARIPEWAVETACRTGRTVRLLVIAEDWCGDASNTVPVLARLGDLAPCLEVRIVRRADYPELMDRYLTDGTRSIPIVIVLDAEFAELGHWGPRPAELQTWVRQSKASLPRAERYKRVRRWYARDRGETTLREVLALLP